MEVICDPCKVAQEVFGIRNWVWGGGKKFDPLNEVGGEEEDFVSCKQFPHTVPFPDTKRDQALILDIPGKQCKWWTMLNECYLPSEVMNLSGLNSWGRSKYSGSFIMKERLAIKTVFSGNRYPSTSVGLVERCGNENGAMKAIRCTSAIVACA